MRKGMVGGIAAGAVGALLLAGVVLAQQGHDQHTAPGQKPMMQGQMPHGTMHGTHGGMMHGAHMGGAAAGLPTLPGQDAFGAVAEVVRLLEADPSTDWSKVDLERLRQHLIDMNEVVLHAAVKPAQIPGGLAMEVSGTGRVEQAIRAMVVPHAAELDQMPEWSARTEPIPGGVRLTVTATEANDARTIARIRGLGFIGLLTTGAHHQPHHLAMAKGERMGGHTH